jgi:dihydroorotate dehydrogenase
MELHLFILSTPVAHNLAIRFAKLGLCPYYHLSAAEQRVQVSTTVFGKQFTNPIGLAAGFDKDGEIIQPMHDLGFGFVEIGTVTPLPQPGNPKPRMFRLTEDQAIINRYGFNSQGNVIVEANVNEFRQPQQQHASERLDDNDSFVAYVKRFYNWLYPPRHAQGGLVGINIGRNKQSESAEDAIADYESNIGLLGPLADFIIINISSPNTPGLRKSQTLGLERLVKACLDARNELPQKPPLLIKLAPDLTEAQLHEIALICMEQKLDGLVVSNSTVYRPDLLLSKHRDQTGGLSGKPLKDQSTDVIRKLYKLTDGTIPIIGVGGVGSGRDVFDKLKAGASLVEVYSMMVYQGPGCVSRIRHELAELMLQSGKRCIEDVVGMDHEDIFWRRREEFQLRNRRRDSQKVLAVPVDSSP